MHQPRPHGRFGPDDAYAEWLMRQVTNIKQTSGIQSLRLTRQLPGGGTATAMDMGGIVKTIVKKPETAVRGEEEEPGVVHTDVPILFSGMVTQSLTMEVEVKLTKTCLRRMQSYGNPSKDPKAEKFGTSQLQTMPRFSVPYADRFSEFLPKGDPKPQYSQLRPSWYSGPMAAVVQIVGGYGKSEAPARRALLNIPDKVRAKIAEQLGDRLLPGYSGMPPKDGQIKYDYKFNECHQVAFASDNKPWLLRINAQGVYAMPLPLVPATTTKAFKAWMEEVRDDEMLWAIERFGGLPTGEQFPTGKAFHAWRRAGVIIKVCDTADFYEHFQFSIACGWSFNTRGTSGANTCYRVDKGADLAYAMAYSMSISIGEMEDPAKDRKGQKLHQYDASILGPYIKNLFSGAGLDPGEKPALLYKMYRKGIKGLIERARLTSSGTSDVNYWLDLEMPPLATCSGSVSRFGDGPLFAKLPLPSSYYTQPQFKLPSPSDDNRACLSFDFTEHRGTGDGPRCDTIIYAYHIGDALKTVRYFHDPATIDDRKPIDNRVDCMTVGSWDVTTFYGKSGVVGSFYLTDKDERETVSEVTEKTNIKGVDRGYDTKPFFSFHGFFVMTGSIWRNRYAEHSISSVRDEGRDYRIAVCIPYYCRDAVLYATHDDISKSTTSEGTELMEFTDPYSYLYWTYDKYFYYRPGTQMKQSGKPDPLDGSPVWVEEERYGSSPCADFADSGPWIRGLPADYTWLVHPEAGVYAYSGGGSRPPVENSSTTHPTKRVIKQSVSCQITDEFARLSDKPDEKYFRHSPDRDGSTFYRDGTRITAGNSLYANTQETDQQTGQRKRFGYTSLANNYRAHHFIGVINE